jgi:hypothetical protein
MIICNSALSIHFGYVYIISYMHVLGDLYWCIWNNGMKFWTIMYVYIIISYQIGSVMWCVYWARNIFFRLDFFVLNMYYDFFQYLCNGCANSAKWKIRLLEPVQLYMQYMYITCCFNNFRFLCLFFVSRNFSIGKKKYCLKLCKYCVFVYGLLLIF